MAEKKDSIRNLIEQGRRAGKLTSTEISDAMEESSRVIDAEQMEKLYEELLVDPENSKKTANDLIYIAEPEAISMDSVNEKLESLGKMVKENDADNNRIIQIITESSGAKEEA